MNSNYHQIDFSQDPIDKLNEILSKNMKVPVSRVWLRNLGIEKIEK